MILRILEEIITVILLLIMVASSSGLNQIKGATGPLP